MIDSTKNRLCCAIGNKKYFVFPSEFIGKFDLLVNINQISPSENTRLDLLRMLADPLVTIRKDIPAQKPEEVYLEWAVDTHATTIKINDVMRDLFFDRPMMFNRWQNTLREFGELDYIIRFKEGNDE